jgi:DNA modification methylase
MLIENTLLGEVNKVEIAIERLRQFEPPDPGDVVIDPVAGSGVTLLATEQLGRKSYGFEIKKEYVDKFNSILATNMQTTIFQQDKPNYKQTGLAI